MDEDHSPGEPTLAERISALSGTGARRALYHMAGVPSGEVRAGLARALDVAEQRAAYLVGLAQRLLPSSAMTPGQTAADDQVLARREELAGELRKRMHAAAEDLAWMLGQAVTRDHPAFRQAVIALGEARWLHQLVEEVLASLALRITPVPMPSSALSRVMDGSSSPGASVPDWMAPASAPATCCQAGLALAGSMVRAGMLRCSVNGAPVQDRSPQRFSRA